ncbi:MULTISPECIES: hypothetical protein [Bradyrhizobium]|jgi:hypothetical protein|uniref:Uncharacterized protein n=2 Tax=Nitrobacteraceae TaxID=41294 RepID=A0A8I2C3J1_BRAEL|nr:MULTISPECIES: hypothetical protein [Bradyrhizobium]MBP1293634.1 hypothetical protein [Bradyrhizobium elkanii]MCS3451416.1 hypothetical protein [Bradyrhizobium elkanii]MCS3566559.1 hypothetical protein [Bradyrhizobium elkanii]MCS3583464.1 hypothetical protein [Bradyrhizobium elkanii]MCS3717033.1 hypothetical protein [Bradyrhizobium elkanii]
MFFHQGLSRALLAQSRHQTAAAISGLRAMRPPMRTNAIVTVIERMSMSDPNWFSWYSFPFFVPLSGGVNQEIETNVVKVSEIEKKSLEKYMRIPTKSPGRTDMKSPADSETMSPTSPI